MSELTKLQLFNANKTNSSEGWAEFYELDSSERLVRMSKVWAGCWALAGGFVFVPILHFLLVPTFFILGPVLGTRAYTAKKLMKNGKGTCPECKKEFVLEERTATEPLLAKCSHCAGTILIERPSSLNT